MLDRWVDLNTCQYIYYWASKVQMKPKEIQGEKNPEFQKQIQKSKS